MLNEDKPFILGQLMSKQITSISCFGMLDPFPLLIFHFCCLCVEKSSDGMALIRASRTLGQENQQFGVSLVRRRKTLSSALPLHNE